MSKTELIKLYDKSLAKWMKIILILRNDRSEDARSLIIDACAFCKACNEDCHKCWINKKICCQAHGLPDGVVQDLIHCWELMDVDQRLFDANVIVSMLWDEKKKLEAEIEKEKQEKPKQIVIPFGGDDGVHDLVSAFLQELHRLEFIHVSNGSTGIRLANHIAKILGSDTEVPPPDKVSIGHYHEWDDGKCIHCGKPACLNWNYATNSCLLGYEECAKYCFEYEGPKTKKEGQLRGPIF